MQVGECKENERIPPLTRQTIAIKVWRFRKLAGRGERASTQLRLRVVGGSTKPSKGGEMVSEIENDARV